MSFVVLPQPPSLSPAPLFIVSPPALGCRPWPYGLSAAPYVPRFFPPSRGAGPTVSRKSFPTPPTLGVPRGCFGAGYGPGCLWDSRPCFALPRFVLHVGPGGAARKNNNRSWNRILQFRATERVGSPVPPPRSCSILRMWFVRFRQGGSLGGPPNKNPIPTWSGLVPRAPPRRCWGRPGRQLWEAPRPVFSVVCLFPRSHP